MLQYRNGLFYAQAAGFIEQQQAHQRRSGDAALALLALAVSQTVGRIFPARYPRPVGLGLWQ